MKIGDIVTLVEGHHLKEFIRGNCIIDDISKLSQRRIRYHIVTSSQEEQKMTWVFRNEIIPVSILRDKKISDLGL